jgi:hypothetical protein
MVTAAPLAPSIPSPDVIRQQLARLGAEHRLLRRQLRLALDRQAEEQRLARQALPDGAVASK